MNAELESYRSLQFTLWGEKIVQISRELLKVGMIAGEVVKNIFDVYGVEKFSYTKYEPESMYPLGSFQPYRWHVWSDLKTIQDLSDLVVIQSTQTFEFEGTIFKSPQEIMAIGSQVILEGKVMHIPMLDFNFSEADLDRNEISKLGLPTGVVLKTDHSFHYYGLELMSPQQWRVWMCKLAEFENSDVLFGSEYLQICLDRGYSALRIFAYPNTKKASTPTVVFRV